MKSEKLGVGKSIWACIAFWLLTIFGSSIAMIWNAITNFISGYGFLDGSLGYLLLQILSTAIGAALAIAAIKSITQKLADIMCIVNMAIAATLFFTLNTVNWIQGNSSWQDIVGIYLAVAVFIIGIVEAAKEIKEKIEALKKAAQLPLAVPECEPEFTEMM